MFGGLTVKVKWLWWRDKTWPTVTLVARLANWLLTFFKKRKIYLFTVFPRIIAGEIFFFRAKWRRLFKGRQLFEEGGYFKDMYCSLEVMHQIFHFIIPLLIKNNHIKWTEHGLFKCSRFVSLINFQFQYPQCQSLSCHWSVFNYLFIYFYY